MYFHINELPGVHNKKEKGRSVNRPRFNEIFYQQAVASGYTINSWKLPCLHIKMPIVSTSQSGWLTAIRSNPGRNWLSLFTFT